jgi:hypothetical protein
MNGGATFQTWQQHSEDLRREAETRRVWEPLMK